MREETEKMEVARAAVRKCSGIHPEFKQHLYNLLDWKWEVRKHQNFLKMIGPERVPWIKIQIQDGK